METDIRSEQYNQFPQGAKIQNGDTKNHQNFSPTRGVGYLSRLQGCLLPNTHTGTVRKYLRFHIQGRSYQFKALPFRLSTSPNGVHCYSKGSKTEGHAQAYKDLPGSTRRLVGESQIPPSLSPAYTRVSKNVSVPGLAGECRKIRTGLQIGLRLRRLPV